MSYKTNPTDRPYFDEWFKNIQNGATMEVFDKDWQHSLGVYNVKKNIENNAVKFTRVVPKYHNWGFEYDEKNDLLIDPYNFKKYTYTNPIDSNVLNDRAVSFDIWYDSIDENKIYNLEENSFMGLLKGNYYVTKNNCGGEKIVRFKRTTCIHYRKHEDPDNIIYISKLGIEPQNYRREPYTRYKYYSKSKCLARAEEESMFPSSSVWF